MWRDELLQDIKGLSGVPIFIAVVLISFFVGEKNLALQLVAGLALAYAITVILRIFFFSQRPDKQKFHNFVEKIDASGFPSLHSMRAAVLATILSLHFSNSLLTAFFAITAIAIAVTRVLQKRHFVRDVIAGLILGVVVGFLVVRFIS
jgi:undecaprenyl-diphosphatase